MAFKMKAGKEGPMRKNFGDMVSPMRMKDQPKETKPTAGTMDKRRNLKQMVNKAKDFIKNNPNVLATGIPGLARNVEILKQGYKKSKKNKEVVETKKAKLTSKQKKVKSPKRLLGKVGKALGSVGTIASGALAGGALGSVLGGRKKTKAASTVSRPVGPMMMVENDKNAKKIKKEVDNKEREKLRKKLSREHNKSARKTEGTKLKQDIRRKLYK